MDNKQIFRIAKKALLLQQLVSEPLNNKELFEVAQEAAIAYRQVSHHLMSDNEQNREQLAKLGKVLSSIETAAFKRYHKAFTGSSRAIL